MSAPAPTLPVSSSAALPPAAPVPRRRPVLVMAAAGGTLALLALLPAALGTPQRALAWPVAAAEDGPAGPKLVRQLERRRPRGVFIVVDSYGNRLRLYRGGDLEREAVCSTGTRIALRDPRSDRVWHFATPTGEWRVQRKVRDPVWAKPDWAFIEEGFLPPTDARHRFDDVSLGDYALYLGDGYIIHGTLFQTLLGQPATHGCIRLGDKDLEHVYRHTPVGASVLLY